MELTLPQKDIYYEQLLFLGDPIHNIGAKICIQGEINIQAFKDAYKALIDQNDAYRMIFYLKGGEAFSKIVDEHNSKLEYVDFSKKAHPESEAANFITENFSVSFNILEG